MQDNTCLEYVPAFSLRGIERATDEAEQHSLLQAVVSSRGSYLSYVGVAVIVCVHCRQAQWFTCKAVCQCSSEGPRRILASC